MAAEKFVHGLPNLRNELMGIVPKLRVRALRNALAAGGRVVQRAARAAAPVISASAASVIAGRRKPGTVRNAISVRTSKVARRRGDVGVFVNVRPAKAGQRGAKSPTDPFYWRWLNWGWNPASGATGGRGKRGKRERRRLSRLGSAKMQAGYRFLETGASRLQMALQAFIKAAGPQIQKLNKPKAPAP